jgi:uncharacterized protein
MVDHRSAGPVMTMDAWWFIALVGLVALLYSMVGHGGASGYLALMAIAGVGIAVARPSALILNCCVSSVAFVQFARAGHFSWKVFWPFALLSVPMALLGSKVELDPFVYKRALAVCLLIAVARMLGWFGKSEVPQRSVPLYSALIIGAVLGSVSGLIGIGGGILLSPILLLAGWADAKTAACVSALFILVNSISGLIGLSSIGLPTIEWSWLLAALVGGAAGSLVGAERLAPFRLRQVLGIVLLFASLKLALP